MRYRCGLGIIALLAITGCGSNAPTPVAGEEYAAMPADKILFGIEHRMLADGMLRATILSDTVYMFEDSAQLRGVRGTFFDDGGAENAKLTSLTGHMNIRSGAMTARGNVVLHLNEGNRIIETPELHFDPESDRIWSDSATTMRQDGTVAHGDGFQSDSRLRNIQITNPRGRIPGVRFEM